MVGAFKVDDAVPLVAKYVASLPLEGDQIQGISRRRDSFPDGDRARARREGTRAALADGDQLLRRRPPLEENEQTRVEAATEVLEIALRDILREELGETYSVSVGLQQPLPQRGAGRISVSFGGAPDKADSMVQRVMQEVQRLQKEGPSADLVNRAKEAAHREHETARSRTATGSAACSRRSSCSAIRS